MANISFCMLFKLKFSWPVNWRWQVRDDDDDDDDKKRDILSRRGVV